MYIESHPRRLSSFCTVRPAFAPQRLDLPIEAPQQSWGGDPDPAGTFRSELQRKSGAEIPIWSGHSDAPSPSLAPGPQLLLLSKRKAQLNHAESTLLQVFFLKNLKPFAINTFEKHGRGGDYG